MNRLLTCTFCGIAVVVMSSSAEAQLVRVGPFGGVSVRAPFVSVDTLPFGGGARIRAPFTSIDTRGFASGYGYGYGYRPYGRVYYDPVPVYSVPVYPAPIYPDVVYPDVVYPSTGSVSPRSGAYQVARPPIDEIGSADLPQRLRASAELLRNSLSIRRDDGEIWLDYLGPDRILQTIDSGGAPESLRELLLNYEGVVGNGTLGSIRGARGFEETYRQLSAFVGTQGDESAPASPASEADSIRVPVPATADATPNEPTPAQPVRPADDQPEAEEEPIEELPVPTPL